MIVPSIWKVEFALPLLHSSLSASLVATSFLEVDYSPIRIFVVFVFTFIFRDRFLPVAQHWYLLFRPFLFNDLFLLGSYPIHTTDALCAVPVDRRTKTLLARVFSHYWFHELLLEIVQQTWRKYDCFVGFLRSTTEFAVFRGEFSTLAFFIVENVFWLFGTSYQKPRPYLILRANKQLSEGLWEPLWSI